MGKTDILTAYQTGRGSIKIRSKIKIEELKNGKEQIIINEIPYLVNKASMIEKIAELVKDKKIVGITDLRDESDKDGIRVVIELKKDVYHEVILNQLYKYTQLENSFGFNMVAIVNGKPQTLTLRRILEEFISHRVVVVTRRTQYLLRKAEARLHILEGLKLAIENIDEVISIIKSSNDSKTAKQKLIERFEFSDLQAQAILDMKLSRLTGLEIDKLMEEYKELLKNIEYFKSILQNKSIMMGIIKEEFKEIREKYGDARRTEIQDSASDFNIKDLIPDEETIVTLTHQGYIKRTVLSTFSAQRRGGKGKSGASKKEDDFVENILVTTNHSKLLFFTNKGKIHFVNVYELPELARDAKGRHLANLLQLDEGESIASVLSVSDKDEANSIFMCTKLGICKKTLVTDFKSGRNGMIALKLRPGDEIVSTVLTNEEDNIFIATKFGKTIQFPSTDVRNMGRNATGVKGITLGAHDEVVSMEVLTGAPLILNVTTKGYGKCSLLSDYRVQTRGGKGLKLSKVTEKTGYICGAKQVRQEDDVMIITRSGKTIRISVSGISIIGRDTQGVKLMDLNNDEIISFAVVREV
jgi:DNA gyrase subunit A